MIENMIECFERNSRSFQCEWLPAPFLPPRELTRQSSGVCLTKEGRITLVNDGRGWALPGGYPEENETLEQALIREVLEEACADVVDFQYIGCQKTIELTPVPQGPVLSYQARYWVRVENQVFDPHFEMTERIEIMPDQFVGMIRWPTKRIARLILDAALQAEHSRIKAGP